MSEADAQAANFSWNPFIVIRDDAQAEALARGGVWAAGLMGLRYVLAITPLVLSGRVFAFAQPDVAILLASAALAVAFAAVLAWRLQAAASAIAAGLLLLWVGVETVAHLWLALRGLNAASGLSLLVDLFCLILAVQAWRGAIALRRPKPTA